MNKKVTGLAVQFRFVMPREPRRASAASLFGSAAGSETQEQVR